jgi:hypothetical protein
VIIPARCGCGLVHPDRPSEEKKMVQGPVLTEMGEEGRAGRGWGWPKLTRRRARVHVWLNPGGLLVHAARLSRLEHVFWPACAGSGGGSTVDWWLPAVPGSWFLVLDGLGLLGDGWSSGRLGETLPFLTKRAETLSAITPVFCISSRRSLCPKKHILSQDSGLAFLPLRSILSRVRLATSGQRPVTTRATAAHLHFWAFGFVSRQAPAP